MNVVNILTYQLTGGFCNVTIIRNLFCVSWPKQELIISLNRPPHHRLAHSLHKWILFYNSTQKAKTWSANRHYVRLPKYMFHSSCTVYIHVYIIVQQALYAKETCIYWLLLSRHSVLTCHQHSVLTCHQHCLDMSPYCWQYKNVVVRTTTTLPAITGAFMHIHLHTIKCLHTLTC